MLHNCVNILCVAFWNVTSHLMQLDAVVRRCKCIFDIHNMFILWKFAQTVAMDFRGIIWSKLDGNGHSNDWKCRAVWKCKKKSIGHLELNKCKWWQSWIMAKSKKLLFICMLKCPLQIHLIQFTRLHGWRYCNIYLRIEREVLKVFRFHTSISNFRNIFLCPKAIWSWSNHTYRTIRPMIMFVGS